MVYVVPGAAGAGVAGTVPNIWTAVLLPPPLAWNVWVE